MRVDQLYLSEHILKRQFLESRESWLPVTAERWRSTPEIKKKYTEAVVYKICPVTI